MCALLSIQSPDNYHYSNYDSLVLFLLLTFQVLSRVAWKHSIPYANSDSAGLGFRLGNINLFNLTVQNKCFCKQCRSWWDGSLWAVSSGSSLFAILSFCNWFLTEPLFARMDVSKFRDGRVHFRNSVMKGLRVVEIWITNNRSPGCTDWSGPSTGVIYVFLYTGSCLSLWFMVFPV